MILYRKAASLRVRRAPSPEPPFWAATTIAPYGARRATPVAIDYTSLRASGADRVEVTVCENVRDDLERMRAIAAPVLIDAADGAEAIFRRGEEVLAWCGEQQLPALLLTSGEVPVKSADVTVIVAAWPPKIATPDAPRWGVAVPIVHPLTTGLAMLEALADEARERGASFFAAVPIEVEPTAKQAIAQSMQLAPDDERYAMLFHGSVEPIHLATERHVAALAAERGMADFVVPPRWDERSNWNAAVLLTKLASRMIALELDLDLAGQIARSARTIAELDKPVARIAEAASLNIIGGIDDTSVDVLTEWIGGNAPGFAEYVDEQWRLKRA